VSSDAGRTAHELLRAIPAADHSFRVAAGSGVTQAQVLDLLVDVVREWLDGL
jgi:hypothetical protein